MEIKPEIYLEFTPELINKIKEVHIIKGKYKSSHYKLGQNLTSIYTHDNRIIYCQFNNNDHQTKINQLLLKIKKIHQKYGKF